MENPLHRNEPLVMNLSGCHAIFALFDPNFSLNIVEVFFFECLFFPLWCYCCMEIYEITESISTGEYRIAMLQELNKLVVKMMDAEWSRYRTHSHRMRIENQRILLRETLKT